MPSAAPLDPLLPSTLLLVLSGARSPLLLAARMSLGLVMALDVPVQVASQLGLAIAVISRHPLYVDVRLVHLDLAVRLHLVVALWALFPLHYADVEMAFDVPVEVAVLLRLVVAVVALLPLNADATFHGPVLREVAVRLGLVIAPTLRRCCACGPCAA